MTVRLPSYWRDRQPGRVVSVRTGWHSSGLFSSDGHLLGKVTSDRQKRLVFLLSPPTSWQGAHKDPPVTAPLPTAGISLLAWWFAPVRFVTLGLRVRSWHLHQDPM